MQAPPQSDFSSQDFDRIRIIGQGLVGSLLAIKLEQAGLPFLVQDENLPGAATVVAPGIVNPLAGKNFSPPDNLTILIGKMLDLMKLAEHTLGEQIWKPCPILRMFAEPAQIDRFKKSLSEEEKATFVEAEYPENTFAELNDVFGSFLTKGGGWANLPLLIRSTRKWLADSNRLIEEKWDPEGEQETNPGEIVIFCEGWQVNNNPHWSFIPHNPAKGEMLIVRFEESLPRDKIYNQSCWAQPFEKDLWRVGATYSWSGFDSEPTLDGANALQERLHLLTPIPFHVEDQLAGVRPIVEDYRPVVGAHPKIPGWYIINATGSKGVLQAPASIDMLLDYLANGSTIRKRWDVSRFA